MAIPYYERFYDSGEGDKMANSASIEKNKHPNKQRRNNTLFPPIHHESFSFRRSHSNESHGDNDGMSNCGQEYDGFERR